MIERLIMFGLGSFCGIIIGFGGNILIREIIDDIKRESK